MFKGTFEQFVELCKEIYLNSEGMEGDFEESYVHHSGGWRRTRPEKINKPRLFVEWSTGGVSGGSCWESSDPQPYTSHDKPKELQILDVILERICPTISFLQYKALYKQLVKYDVRTENEYYGNSTDYANLQVDLKELFDYLEDHYFINQENEGSTNRGFAW